MPHCVFPEEESANSGVKPVATEAEHRQAQREHELISDILRARDLLSPIVTGEIERGHCVAGQHVAYGAEPGNRKTTLSDARKIAKTVTFIINRAIDEYDRGERG
jgi:hypothetical protein